MGSINVCSLLLCLTDAGFAVFFFRIQYLRGPLCILQVPWYPLALCGSLIYLIPFTKLQFSIRVPEAGPKDVMCYAPHDMILTSNRNSLVELCK